MEAWPPYALGPTGRHSSAQPSGLGTRAPKSGGLKGRDLWGLKKALPPCKLIPMLARVYSPAVNGIEAYPVAVELDSGRTRAFPRFLSAFICG
jgi:hypothetical protein